MTIWTEPFGFAAACSLRRLPVAAVSVATLRSFGDALSRAERASARALDAAEMRDLATRTARATEGISGRIARRSSGFGTEMAGFVSRGRAF